MIIISHKKPDLYHNIIQQTSLNFSLYTVLIYRLCRPGNHM